MLGMKVARTADPSLGIRNLAPAPRWQRWSEGETVRLVKAAWRHGYKGLACIIAVAWDTQFSPVDVRTLAARHRATVGGRLVFDRQAEGRAKTGRAAIGTVSTDGGMVEAYLETLAIELHPDAILFRTRTGAAYGRETLGPRLRRLRALAFPGDKRRLMDMRRSGVVEASPEMPDRSGGCQAGKFHRALEHAAQDVCAGRYRSGPKHGHGSIKRAATDACRERKRGKSLKKVVRRSSNFTRTAAKF